MQSLDKTDPSIIYAMFKGEPGTRKSTQALSFPLPQYWFSWDRKMSGILVPAKKWGIDMSQIDYDDYDNWTKAEKKLEEFQRGHKYKTLVFDSLTSCADMTLRQTLSAKTGQTRSSGKTAGKVIAGISVNEIEDFNAESAALQNLISLTKDIQAYTKCVIILVAHVVQAEYRSTLLNETHVSRTIITAGKKVAPKIPAYCGEIYHFNMIGTSMSADAPKRYGLFTEHTGDDFARTALGLDRQIIFDDNPIYLNYVKPAIDKLIGGKV